MNLGKNFFVQNSTTIQAHTCTLLRCWTSPIFSFSLCFDANYTSVKFHRASLQCCHTDKMCQPCRQRDRHATTYQSPQNRSSCCYAGFLEVFILPVMTPRDRQTDSQGENNTSHAVTIMRLVTIGVPIPGLY